MSFFILNSAFVTGQPPVCIEFGVAVPARSTIIVVFGFKSGDNSAELMKTDINLLPLRVNG